MKLEIRENEWQSAYGVFDAETGKEYAIYQKGDTRGKEIVAALLAAHRDEGDLASCNKIREAEKKILIAEIERNNVLSKALREIAENDDPHEAVGIARAALA